MIVVAEGGGLVDDACAVSVGDIGINENTKGFSPILCVKR